MQVEIMRAIIAPNRAPGKKPAITALLGKEGQDDVHVPDVVSAFMEEADTLPPIGVIDVPEAVEVEEEDGVEVESDVLDAVLASVLELAVLVEVVVFVSTMQ